MSNFLKKISNSELFVFLLPVFIYLTVIIYINPVGEFPVNDDWIFKRQIETFFRGNSTLSAYIDPAFITQGIIAFFWAHLFGFGFTSLRILTICITVLTALGLFKIGKVFKVNKIAQITLLLVFLFNPLVFHLSMSFMTEIYFLFFLVWSIYFLLQNLYEAKYSNLFVGIIFASLCFLVRQFGLALFIAFFVTSIYLYILGKRSKKQTLLELIYTASIFAVTLLTYNIWPRYVENVGSVSGQGFNNLLSNTINAEHFSNRIKMLLWSIPYISFFTIPLMANINLKSQKLYVQVYTLVIILVTTLLIFELDVFPVGNILYLEGLNLKTNFKHNLSLLDNLLSKAILSILIGASVGYSVNFLATVIEKFKSNHIRAISGASVFIFLATLFSILPLLFSNDFYDRYLLPTFILSLIGLLKFLGCEIRVNKFLLISLAVLISLSVLLQTDYIRKKQLMWLFATEIQQTKSLYTQIYLDGTYGKYTKAQRENDYTGLNTADPTNNYICYVQDYTENTSSPIFKSIDTLNSIFLKYIENPRSPDTRKPTNLPSVKNNLNQLIYRQAYNSPLYNLIGKSSSVGAWCLNK